MDRLTQVAESGEIIVGKRFMIGLDNVPHNLQDKCYTRLSKYEDTALMPEEIVKLKQQRDEAMELLALAEKYLPDEGLAQCCPIAETDNSQITLDNLMGVDNAE